MTMKPFFMVWSPSADMPKVCHPTLEQAKAEAERLAEKCAPQTFVVLRSVGEAKKVHVKWDDHWIDGEIEF